MRENNQLTGIDDIDIKKSVLVTHERLYYTIQMNSLSTEIYIHKKYTYIQTYQKMKRERMESVPAR